MQTRFSHETTRTALFLPFIYAVSIDLFYVGTLHKPPCEDIVCLLRWNLKNYEIVGAMKGDSHNIGTHVYACLVRNIRDLHSTNV